MARAYSPNYNIDPVPTTNQLVAVDYMLEVQSRSFQSCVSTI